MPILTGDLVASTRRSKLVRKVGTNLLISRKIVSFSFSEEVVTTTSRLSCGSKVQFGARDRT
jgi:hypothetical protein